MKIEVKKRIAKCMLLLTTIFLANSPAPAATLLFEDVPAASSADLDSMRGGFVTKNHGFISLSIEKATRVDGILQVTNSLRIPDMARLVRGLGRYSFQTKKHHPKNLPETPSVSPVATTKSQNIADHGVAGQNIPEPHSAMQTNQNVAVKEVAAPEVSVKQDTPAPQIQQPEVAVAPQPEVAPQNKSAPSGIASQAPMSQEVVSSPSDLARQNDLLVLNSGFSTVIQNGLDQKTIQDLTIVEATVVNAKLVKEMQLVSRISEQLIDAMH